MSDKPPAQIIDLFEAFSSDPEMNEALKADDKKLRDLGAYDTSVGDVPAPLVENECCKCRTKLMRSKKSDSYICDACFDIMQSDGEGELAVKLATSVERNAVVKHLRLLAKRAPSTLQMKTLEIAANAIEQGEHVK